MFDDVMRCACRSLCDSHLNPAFWLASNYHFYIDLMASVGSEYVLVLIMESERQHRLLYAVRLSVSSRATCRTRHLMDQIPFIFQNIPDFTFPNLCKRRSTKQNAVTTIACVGRCSASVPAAYKTQGCTLVLSFLDQNVAGFTV